MVRARFRFAEALHPFLAPAHRGVVFEARCAEHATAKHMIEALGVPHTEVGALRINGEPASLGRVLAEGDLVEVLGPCAGAPGPAPPRFIADAHLGGLARRLRLAGFDTVFDAGAHDAGIERLAGAEARIVLTRDRELLKRRGVAAGAYVHAQRPAAQWDEVARRFGLAPQARPFTRCLVCNGELADIAPGEVEGALPPDVRSREPHVRRCTGCARVYWEGSHFRRLEARLRAMLGASRPDDASPAPTPIIDRC